MTAVCRSDDDDDDENENFKPGDSGICPSLGIEVEVEVEVEVELEVEVEVELKVKVDERFNSFFLFGSRTQRAVKVPIQALL